MKQSNKLLDAVSIKSDIEMTVISNLVYLYDNASLEEKIYWFLYGEICKLYCDRKRWRAGYAEREQYKANFKSLCPGTDQYFYYRRSVLVSSTDLPGSISLFLGFQTILYKVEIN